MTHINSLPEEMIRRIQSLLPPRNLKMSVLVCQRWRELGEDPSLWTWCTLTVSEPNHIQKLSVKRVRNIHVTVLQPDASWQVGDWEALFQATGRLGKLKKIDGLDSIVTAVESLRQVKPQLLAEALACLEEVDLRNTRISNTQMEALFMAMVQNSQIKILVLRLRNLSSLEPDLFGRALCRLEQIDVCGTRITKRQIKSFFTCASQNSQLKTLDMSHNNLSSLEPWLLARVVSRLEEVYLVRTRLTNDQAKPLFTSLSQNTHLKELGIGYNPLSSVDPGLFATVMSKLEDIVLCQNSVTTEQIHTLLTKISESNRTKKLDLSYNDISMVEPETLASVLIQLEEVELEGTDITTDQMVALSSHISENSCIKKIVLAENNLSLVEPEVLVSVLSCIDDVDLAETNLTSQQISSILVMTQENTKLKKLAVLGNNAIAEVDPDLIEMAKERIDIEMDSEDED